MLSHLGQLTVHVSGGGAGNKFYTSQGTPWYLEGRTVPIATGLIARGLKKNFATQNLLSDCLFSPESSSQGSPQIGTCTVQSKGHGP